LGWDMRTLATRGAIWSHSDSYVVVCIMDVEKGCVILNSRG
jgi:hypothetical protein